MKLQDWIVKFSIDGGYRELIYSALNATEAQRMAINDGVMWRKVISVTLV